MNKQQARDFLQRFLNTMPSFCDQLVAIYNAVRSGRATATEKQTLESLIRQREQAIEALSVLYADLPLDASVTRFSHLQRFIQKGLTLIEKPHVGVCLGTIIKALLELARFRALNSTRDKAWWQGRIRQLTHMLRRMR